MSRHPLRYDASMSLTYRHLLIPRDQSYVPHAQAIATFLHSCATGGWVGDPASFAVGQLAKQPQEPKESVNPFTGEMVRLIPPSRRAAELTNLDSPSLLLNAVRDSPEYDVWASSSVMPKHEPMILGVVGEQGWERFVENYHFSITCHVRACPVFLSHFACVDDVDRPFDPNAIPVPRLDEDSGDAPVDGVFVHPELGSFVLEGCGSASFWIDFSPGKFLHPRAEGNSISLIDRAVLELAEDCFAVGFQQACSWD